MNHDEKLVQYSNPGEEKVLSTAVLTSGLPYQRPVEQTKVNRFIKQWNSRLLSPIVVSYRDSK